MAFTFKPPWQNLRSLHGDVPAMLDDSEIIYTLWLFYIAMENEPFIDDVPIKMVIFHGYVK